MKIRAVKEMFAIQHNCNPDAIEVEYLATIPDGITEFKVSIQTGETQEAVVFSCKTQPYDPTKYAL